MNGSGTVTPLRRWLERACVPAMQSTTICSYRFVLVAVVEAPHQQCLVDKVFGKVVTNERIEHSVRALHDIDVNSHPLSFNIYIASRQVFQ